jgi:hypothetical protein
MAVIWTAETLEMEGMRSDAIKWINLTSDYFESDKEFAAVKRSIGG